MKVRLTDICDFQGGSQPPKNQWRNNMCSGYIRMLQIRDFTQQNVSPEYIKITNSIKTCQSDDILIARYGASIGKILTGLSGAYNVAIMKTIPNEEKLSKRYLKYFLLSNVFQRFIKNIGSRAAQAGFNKSELSTLMINNRSLDEQERISKIFEQLDSLIKLRAQQLLKLDILVKSRYPEVCIC